MWLVWRLRPDLFVGKLKQVKWITASLMALMFITLAGSFWLDRQQPPKPVRAVAPLPAINDIITTTVTPPGEQSQRETVRRFFEIEDKK